MLFLFLFWKEEQPARRGDNHHYLLGVLTIRDGF